MDSTAKKQHNNHQKGNIKKSHKAYMTELFLYLYPERNDNE